MQIIKVDESHEKGLFDYIQDKEYEYFFLVMDYKQNLNDNHLFMVIDENQKIQGIFQVLYGQIQVRGTIKAIHVFLEYLREEKIEFSHVTGTKLHQDFLSEQFPTPIDKVTKYRMIFSKELVNRKSHHKLHSLEGTEENKEKIAALIRTADPKHWGGVQSAHLVVDSSHPYFAVMDEQGVIVSLAGLWFDEQMGLVNVIATHPEFRKKGYATSILSSSVEWLLKKSKIILIDVRTENAPAIRIYQKAGFQIAFEYVVYSLSDTE